jgi:hypothetical protein
MAEQRTGVGRGREKEGGGGVRLVDAVHRPVASWPFALCGCWVTRARGLRAQRGQTNGSGFEF